MHDTNSLAHSTWNCKYHIVFAPKYRRKVFFVKKYFKYFEKYCKIIWNFVKGVI